MFSNNEKKEDVLKIFAYENNNVSGEYEQWDNEDNQSQYIEKISSQIGWVIINFNSLEWQLHEIIKKYLCNETPELNSLFFENIAKNGFSSKVELIKNFFKQFYLGEKKHLFDSSTDFNDFNKEVDNLIKSLKDVAELRNKYAHCFWHRMNENHFVEFKYNLKANSGLQKVSIRFNPNDLKEDLENLTKTEELLVDFEYKFDEIYSNS